MGVMAGFCSSDLVYGNRGLSGNGAALLQYNGLRPLENKQMAASARNPSGSFASSSECHSLHHCCIGLRRNAKATRCKERLKRRLAAHIQTRCMYVGHPVHSSGEDVMRLITVFLRDNYSNSVELFGLLTELPRIYEGPVKAVATPTIAAPKRETDPKKRIVITGMGLVSVFGNDIDTFYNKLLEGESGISTIDRFDASTFSVRFAGQIRDFSSKGYIDGKNDRRLDDCWRYCLVAGRRALEDAELSPDILENMDKSRIGVLVGTGMGGLTAFSNGVESLIQKGYKKITPFFIPYSITNMGSALLAIDTGLMGPNYSISTACATANYCFYAAANHIRRGEADIMVAGGTEAAVLPTGVGGFIACRALSQRNDEPEKASRPWDKDRDGFVMGEGSGVLVMESLEHARNRGANIIAEYLGGAITCDAHHMTDPRSDGLGVSSCIIKSLEDAGVSPEEVNYVNAHATSTLAGDLAEVNAIKKVFKDTSEMKMNGTKSMIGHCLGAAGGLEAIATIKAITTGWLHPTINQFNLEPDVSIDTVPNTKKKHDVHVAISNSFGFGGHNSVVVFAPFTP